MLNVPRLRRGNRLTDGLCFAIVGGYPFDLITGAKGTPAGPNTIFNGISQYGGAFESTVLDGTHNVSWPDREVARRVGTQHTLFGVADWDTLTGDATLVGLPAHGGVSDPYQTLAMGMDQPSVKFLGRYVVGGSRQDWLPAADYWQTGRHSYLWTRNGSFQILYKDGGLFDQATSGSASAVDFTGTSTEILINGYSTSNAILSADGRLAFVGIWDRALTAGEVRLLANDPEQLWEPRRWAFPNFPVQLTRPPTPSMVNLGHAEGTSGITKPASGQAGDFYVVAAYTENGTTLGLTGFASVGADSTAADPNAGGVVGRVNTFWRLYDGSEGATFSPSGLGSYSHFAAWIVRGADPTQTPLSNAIQNDTTDTATITGVTTLVNECLAFMPLNRVSGPTNADTGPAGGWANQLDVDTHTSRLFTKVFTTAGATGNQTVTFDDFADQSPIHAGLIVFRPIPPAGTLQVNQVLGKDGPNANPSLTSNAFTSIAGSLLVVVVTGFNISTAVNNNLVTDSKGGTWVKVPDASNSIHSPGGECIGVWYLKDGSRGASHTITFTATVSSSNLNLHIVEITGFDTTAPLDTTTDALGTDGSGNPIIITAAGAIVGNQIAIAGTASSDGGDGTWTNPTGYTDIYEQGTSSQRTCAGAWYKIGETGTPSLSASFSNNSGGNQWVFVSFKVASGGGGGNTTVTPTKVDTVTAVPAPTLLATAVATPTAVATVAAVPAPTLKATSVVTPTVVATIVAIPGPTIRIDVNVTPTAVATVTAIPAPQIVDSDTVTPASVATVTTVPAPTPNNGSGNTTVFPSTVPTVVAVPAPTLVATSKATPAAVATVVAIPAPTLVATSQVSPAAVVTVAAVPAPTLKSTAVATPAVVPTVVAVPAPGISAAANITATVVPTVTTIPAPTPISNLPAPDWVNPLTTEVQSTRWESKPDSTEWDTDTSDTEWEVDTSGTEYRTE